MIPQQKHLFLGEEHIPNKKRVFLLLEDGEEEWILKASKLEKKFSH